MRIAVTGGRDVIPTSEQLDRFQEIWEDYGGTILFEGGATGVDEFMRNWSALNDIPCATISVNTRIDGPWPGAGPARSKRMLRDGCVELLIAFPGGSGTRRACLAAKGLNIPIERIE